MIRHRIFVTAMFLTVAFFGVVKVTAEEVKQEIIPAIKLQESAVIDGVLDDAVWQKAFYDPGRVYIDNQMLKPLFLDESTETWVYYNEEGIFLAFKCIDKDIIYQYTQVKNTPELGRGYDDLIAFNFVVDAEKHYDPDAQYWYMLNPANAYYFRPAVGRASKQELLGECIGKAKVYQGYWTAEVMLKWSAVDYPVKDNPYDMLLLPQRWHKSPGMASCLAHYSKTFAGTDTRLNFCRFAGVKPPQKGVETKISPNIYTGWSQEGWEKEMGLDCRLRPTSETNFFLTVNPDFKNTEQYVTRIDPVYGPARQQDYRYFFQEGNQILMLPWNLYTPKIQEIDIGLSGYGKLYDISLVSLATLYRGGDHNFILRGYKDWKQNHLGGAYLGHRETENSVFWADFRRNAKWYELLADVGQSMIGREDSGRKYWAMLKLKRTNLFGDAQFTLIDKNYRDDIGFHPFKGIYGSTFSITKQKAWAGGKRFYEARTEIEVKNFTTGEIHRRSGYAYIWHRRGQNGIFLQLEGGRFGQFEEEGYQSYDDLLVNLMYAVNYGNNERFLTLDYLAGKRQGKTLHQFDPSFAVRFGKLRARFSNQFLWHEEFKYQAVVNLNYELTRTLGLGSRFVWNKNGRNIYFALHRSGFKGAELFIILGDPNAEKFQKRLIGKVVMAF